MALEYLMSQTEEVKEPDIPMEVLTSAVVFAKTPSDNDLDTLSAEQLAFILRGAEIGQRGVAAGVVRYDFGGSVDAYIDAPYPTPRDGPLSMQVCTPLRAVQTPPQDRLRDPRHLILDFTLAELELEKNAPAPASMHDLLTGNFPLDGKLGAVKTAIAHALVHRQLEKIDGDNLDTSTVVVTRSDLAARLVAYITGRHAAALFHTGGVLHYYVHKDYNGWRQGVAGGTE